MWTLDPTRYAVTDPNTGTTTSRPRLYTEHDSLAAFVHAMKSTPVINFMRGCASDDARGENPTTAECYRLIEEGWPEGREHMQTAMDLAKSHVVALPSITTRHDVAGEQPDVARYVSGMPDHMQIEELSIERRAPVLRLRIAINALGATTRETLTARGAAIMAQVDAWEQAGTQVEIIACTDSRVRQKDTARDYPGAHHPIINFDVLVKRAGEPLEIDRLAFVFIHPSFFRRLAFGARDRLDARFMMKCIYASPLDIGAHCTSLLNAYRRDAGAFCYIPPITEHTAAAFDYPDTAAKLLQEQFTHALTPDALAA